SRLETVLAGFKLSNHGGCTSRCPLIKTCRTGKFRDAPSDFTALAGARYDRFGRALRVSPMAAAMSASSFDVPPLLPASTPAQSRAILGAMRAVAETGGAASEDDRLALESANRFVFGHAGPFDMATLAPVAPAALAEALAGTDLARDALKFLTVMAFVDGRLDKAKIAAVLGYAAALGVAEHYLDEIRQAAEDRLQEVLADMTLCNMESITGAPWAGGDINAWLLPYTGAAEDPALAARFEALGDYPAESFGRAFWNQFKKNGYAFPGQPKGLNAIFT